MKVYFENEGPFDRVNVWVYQEGPPGSGIRIMEAFDVVDSEVQFRLRPPTGEGELKSAPTFRWRRDFAEAFAAASAELLPPDRAQGAHLADAITVRDRLLKIVEDS